MVSGIFQSSVPSRNNNKNSVSAPRVGYALCIFVWVWVFKALFRIFQKMRNLPKENCGMIWWVISMQKRFSVAGFFNHHVCPENCTRQDETCTQDGTARPYRMDGPQQARCRFLPSDDVSSATIGELGHESHSSSTEDLQNASVNACHHVLCCHLYDIHALLPKASNILQEFRPTCWSTVLQ